MIETITLMPGVTLRVCRDSRFKQGALSIQFVRQMDRQEAALTALLPNVLLRGTAKCPDLRAITQRLDSLYGAAVSLAVRRVGDYQTTGLYCGFMDDRFALPGDKVLQPMIAFVEELLLDPLLEEGQFCQRFVESEKKNLIATIQAERNDKRAYAMDQLLKTICGDDPFGIPRTGEPEQVAAIDAGMLYRHYRKILRESPIALFYVGSAPAEQVAALLKPMFARLDREPVTLRPQTPLTPGKAQEQEEIMEVTQGKLCLGYLTPITNRSPEFAAMQVLNVIFGSGMTSKLFQNVREKLSLCYSVGSAYYSTKGILAVSAGIDFDKEELTRQEVARQLEACQKGDISQQELQAAKEALLSSLRAVADSPAAIESYYSTAALSGLGMDVEEYMEVVRRVTAEDAAAAARSLTYQCGYFLKGDVQ